MQLNNNIESPVKKKKKYKIEIYIVLKECMQIKKTHEKILNITNYQRNANQIYSEAPPYTGQNGHHQEIQTQTYKKFRNNK